HRTVNKGEQGIKIFCPMTFKKDKSDQEMETERTDKADDKDEIITTYRVGYTFDISQTSGEPLPEIVTNLNRNVDGYSDLLHAIKESAPEGFRIELLPDSQFRNQNIRGFTDGKNKVIAVRDGIDQAQTIKTLLHEIAHAQLHAPELDMPMEQRTDRRTREVQAESTAFVVCNKYGIDTSEYTFPYIASWSSGKDLKELQTSLETIQRTSSGLIDKIDSKLIELNPEKYTELLKGFEAALKATDRPKAPFALGR
ncbi:MAG: DNA primase, partial [Eubacteriales bacterium]|nr:DNA primase [Eubacteriales bacterium]